MKGSKNQGLPVNLGHTALKESFCAYFALPTVTSVQARLAKPQSGPNLHVAAVSFQARLVAPMRLRG